MFTRLVFRPPSRASMPMKPIEGLDFRKDVGYYPEARSRVHKNVRCQLEKRAGLLRFKAEQPRFALQ